MFYMILVIFLIKLASIYQLFIVWYLIADCKCFQFTLEKHFNEIA